MSCPVCKLDSAQVWSEPDGVRVRCARCGSFSMTGTMVSTAVKDKDRFIVSAYLRGRELRKMPPLTINSRTAVPLQNKTPGGSFNIGWETIVSQEFPKSISERIDQALCNFSKMAAPGKWSPCFGESDWVTAYAEDEESWEYVLKQLKEDGFIELRDLLAPRGMLENGFRLTPKGWNRVADMERGTAALLYKQAFVAMWFDQSMSQAWESGFKLGIEDEMGIKAVRVDLKEHNEKICDVIVAEILKSSFLVADFTGNRGGVYFEAGFAKGLGIPVIFTCQKGKWEKQLHFDTRQYNHIIWEDPEDLKNKLKNRIRATISISVPRGAKSNSGLSLG